MSAFGCGKAEDNSSEYIVCYFDEVMLYLISRNTLLPKQPSFQDLSEPAVNWVDLECTVDCVLLPHHKL